MTWMAFVSGTGDKVFMGSDRAYKAVSSSSVFGFI